MKIGSIDTESAPGSLMLAIFRRICSPAYACYAISGLACHTYVTAVESERDTRPVQFVPGNLTQPEFLKMCKSRRDEPVEAGDGRRESRKASEGCELIESRRRKEKTSA